MKINTDIVSKEAYKRLVVETLPHLLKGDFQEVEESSKTIHKIMNVFSDFVYDIYKNAEELGNLMSINYIYGEQLDNYGDNFNMKRLVSESDEDFRIRIITNLSIRYSNSSIPSICEVVKAVTGKEFETFKLVERPQQDNPASFAFSPKDFNAEELNTALEAIELVRGAGIQLLLVISQILTWQDLLNNTWGYYKDNDFIW